MYSFDLLILIACAVFYYRAGKFENAPALLWASLSVLVYMLTWVVLAWGTLGCIGAQVGLFFAIAIARALFSKRPVA